MFWFNLLATEHYPSKPKLYLLDRNFIEIEAAVLGPILRLKNALHWQKISPFDATIMFSLLLLFILWQILMDEKGNKAHQAARHITENTKDTCHKETKLVQKYVYN